MFPLYVYGLRGMWKLLDYIVYITRWYYLNILLNNRKYWLTISSLYKIPSLLFILNTLPLTKLHIHLSFRRCLTFGSLIVFFIDLYYQLIYWKELQLLKKYFFCFFFSFQPCSVFLFDKSIADKLHKPRRRDIVTSVLKRDVRLLTQLHHPNMLHILHPIEETRYVFNRFSKVTWYRGLS